LKQKQKECLITTDESLQKINLYECDIYLVRLVCFSRVPAQGTSLYGALVLALAAL